MDILAMFLSFWNFGIAKFRCPKTVSNDVMSCYMTVTVLTWSLTQICLVCCNPISMPRYQLCLTTPICCDSAFNKTLTFSVAEVKVIIEAVVIEALTLVITSHMCPYIEHCECIVSAT